MGTRGTLEYFTQYARLLIHKLNLPGQENKAGILPKELEYKPFWGWHNLPKYVYILSQKIFLFVIPNLINPWFLLSIYIT
jgi:hypothetical protein